MQKLRRKILAHQISSDLYTFEFIGFGKRLVQDYSMSKEFYISNFNGNVSEISTLKSYIHFPMFRSLATLKYMLLLEEGNGFLSRKHSGKFIPYKKIILDLTKQQN